jgi:DNA-binding MarR family transcriptional regulator
MNTPRLSLRIAQGLNKLGLAIKTHEWSAAARQQLSPTQGQILSLLAARGPLRLGRVAEELAVTPATASDAVGALEKKGLVVKKRAGDDGRALAILLTRAGGVQAAKTAAWPDFLAAAVGVLSPSERVVLHRALVKMIRTLQEQGRIPVARMCVNCRFFRPAVHANRRTPHHCDYVDAAFGDTDLRIDCPDFNAAPTSRAWSEWLRSQAAGRAENARGSPGSSRLGMS